MSQSQPEPTTKASLASPSRSERINSSTTSTTKNHFSGVRKPHPSGAEPKSQTS